MSALTCKIYDLATVALADISAITLERSLARALNKPSQFTITAHAGSSLLTAIAADGYPNLRKGNRKLIVWETGITAPIFHGRIQTIERVGDGSQNLVTISAIDPLIELGYDADDRAGRPVRDATGNFINPTFTGTGTGGPTVISGPDLIYQILTNSQGADSEGGAHPGEGPLPIDLTTGTFDLNVPPAIDLNCVDSMDWPVLCGDFIQQLVQTGVVDIDLRPVAPTEGLPSNIMAALSAVSSLGTDRSATVHFDYWTGSHNAAACRHLESFATINNKLYDYLGPRKDKQHWRGNITPGSPGTTVNPAASRALYGQFMSIRVFDSIGSESSSRPLYIALWNGEQGWRVEPRDLLYITPAAGAKALFEAGKDFDVGDRIQINTGGDFGVALAQKQRVYGYTKTWSREDVVQVSEFLTSADPA